MAKEAGAAKASHTLLPLTVLWVVYGTCRRDSKQKTKTQTAERERARAASESERERESQRERAREQAFAQSD